MHYSWKDRGGIGYLYTTDDAFKADVAEGIDEIVHLLNPSSPPPGARSRRGMRIRVKSRTCVLLILVLSLCLTGGSMFSGCSDNGTAPLGRTTFEVRFHVDCAAELSPSCISYNTLGAAVLLKNGDIRSQPPVIRRLREGDVIAYKEFGTPNLGYASIDVDSVAEYGIFITWRDTSGVMCAAKCLIENVGEDATYDVWCSAMADSCCGLQAGTWVLGSCWTKGAQ